MTVSGALQSRHATALGIVSLHDLGLVERAADNGQEAGKLLATWRSRQPEVALQQYIGGRGDLLYTPRSVMESFSAVVDELVAQQTGYLEAATATVAAT